MQTALVIWLAISITCLVLALLTPERLIPELIDTRAAKVLK